MADKRTEMLADPDFWDKSVSDDTRIDLLRQNDTNFDKASPNMRKQLLEGLRKKNQEGQSIAQSEQQASQQRGSWWNQNIAQPANAMVGQAMEALASPAVPIARMVQGESPSAAFTGNEATLGAGGVAKSSRESAASAVVPQEPWQAALMAAGPAAKGLGSAVPALGGVLGRVGTAAALGAGSEAAMGDREQSVDSRALSGALRAGGMQTGVEALGGLSGLIGRRFQPGAQAQEATDLINKGVSNVEPALSTGKMKPAEAGKFWNEGGAKSALEGVFENKMTDLDHAISGRPQWLDSPELRNAFKTLEKTYQSKPGADQLLKDLEPDPQKGFLPSQAAKILARTREALIGAGNEKMSGHMASELMDNVISDLQTVAQSSGNGDMAKALEGARTQFARGSGLRDLLEGAYKESPAGYRPDMRVIQKGAGSTDLAKRVTPDELKTIKESAYRGAKDVPPGSQDFYPGESQYMPYPSGKGVGIFALRKLMHANKYAGNKPLTATEGQRGTVSRLGTMLSNKTSKKLNSENEE